MARCKKQERKRAGFTLTEVMVTLVLFSFLVPGVLMMQNMITRVSHYGINRNVSMAAARYFQQYFVRKVNASGLNIRIQDSGEKVLLELYEESTGEWKDGAFCYLSRENKIVFFPAGSSSSIPVVDHVYPNESNPIFKTEEGMVKCNFYIGKTRPEMTKKATRFTTPGVFVELTASPRNVGKRGT